jgi:hypothetical protein
MWLDIHILVKKEDGSNFLQVLEKVFVIELLSRATLIEMGAKILTMKISLFTSCTQGMMEYIRTIFKTLDSICFPGWFAMFLLKFSV